MYSASELEPSSSISDSPSMSPGLRYVVKDDGARAALGSPRSSDSSPPLLPTAVLAQSSETLNVEMRGASGELLRARFAGGAARSVDEMEAADGD